LLTKPRAPLEESRKWGIYNMTNLLFKTYFKVSTVGLTVASKMLIFPLQINSVGLTKNLLRAISASSADLPPPEVFPKSHIVTFEYYVGVIHFLDENYAEVLPSAVSVDYYRD
jgi:hypothetical protein